ncbi:hypothetical protein ACFVFI_39210, partial [Streptomyces sp. NPDC057705]
LVRADPDTGREADRDALGPGDPVAEPGAERGADRSPWTRNDALVAVAAGTIDLVGYSLGMQTEGRVLSVAAAVSLVVSAMPLIARRARPVTVLAAVLALGVLVNLTTPPTPHFTLTLMVALYTVARFSRPAVAAAAAVAAVPLIPAG